MDMLTQLLEKHNIYFLEGTKKKEGGSNFEYKKRVHYLVSSTLRSSSFIIDSRALSHMVSTREAFSLLDASNDPKIVLGDDSKTESKWKGRIYLNHGSFINVLYVPYLAANIILVYHATHAGSHNKVVFTPSDVEITKFSNGRVIEKCFVDHSYKVYKFSHFMPFSNPSSLLTHANESNKIWHDRFDHLNYK